MSHLRIVSDLPPEKLMETATALRTILPETMTGEEIVSFILLFLAICGATEEGSCIALSECHDRMHQASRLDNLGVEPDRRISESFKH